MDELRLQVCERYDATFVDASDNDICGVATQTLHLRPLHALRLPLTNGTTGWYIWGGEYSADVDFYKASHTYHLETTAPELFKFLALPPGYRILLADRHEEVWFDPTLLEPN